MSVVDLAGVLEREPDFVSPDGDARFWGLGSSDRGQLWIGRFQGDSPWTRHAEGDALLHTLEGVVLATLLHADREERHECGPGTLLVVPRGCWHRLHAAGPVLQWGVAPGEPEHSEADDPR